MIGYHHIAVVALKYLQDALEMGEMSILDVEYWQREIKKDPSYSLELIGHWTVKEAMAWK